MPRISPQGLLIVAASLLVCACGEKPRTVAQHLHDIDTARAIVKKYETTPGGNDDNPDYLNAFDALQKIQYNNECWIKSGPSRFITKNTIHECLDKKGYLR